MQPRRAARIQRPSGLKKNQQKKYGFCPVQQFSTGICQPVPQGTAIHGNVAHGKAVIVQDNWLYAHICSWDFGIREEPRLPPPLISGGGNTVPPKVLNLNCALTHTRTHTHARMHARTHARAHMMQPIKSQATPTALPSTGTLSNVHSL